MTQPTRKIGRYEILERVGQGGMGVLYRAHDPVLDRDVAIKMMLVDLAAEPGARERFEREARAVAKLQHRNVVTIHEFGETDGSPYIVMEFLGGHDLEALMRRRPPLRLDEKLDIVIQLCAGLGFAHERGIVHRDVKPSNVRVLEDGTVKILDFGIAKMAQSSTTARGQVLGSPSYMAPELLTEGPIDGRADLFSTGVLLYELLSGRKPFAGDSPTAIVYQILHAQPPALASLVPDLPPQLATIVERALEKDPARRYARASELMADLQLVRLAAVTLSGPTTPIPRVPEVEFPRAVDARTPTPTDSRGRLEAPGEQALEVGVARGVPRRRLATGTAVGLGAVALVLALAGGMRLLNRPAPPVAPRARPTQVSGALSPSGPVAPAEPATPLEPPASARVLNITTEPPGARILIDGRDTGLVTPARIPIEGRAPNALRLARDGYQPAEVELTAEDLEAGTRHVKLVPLVEPPAAPGIVEFSGEYPFSVLEGTRVLSQAAIEHELTLPARETTLRLVNPTYSLDFKVTVSPNPKRRQHVSAPGLGTLNVYAALETCLVKIDGREVDYPPVVDRLVAAGPHRVTLECPDGRRLAENVVIRAGERTTVTFGSGGS